MQESPRFADSESYQGEAVPIPNGPSALLVHLDKTARRLTTPWQICMIRVELLRKCSLPEGVILDPACGAGLQVSALANALKKDALAIELNQERAEMAAANLARISAWLGNENTGSVIIGDGTNSTPIIKLFENEKQISLFYFDPARPSGSTTHDLSEMRPLLNEVLDAWKTHLNETDFGPAIVLDLSPRLSELRRSQVEELIEERWPKIAKTWQWASRGSGRIDRLSLWLGAAADPQNERRFIRIPPSIHSEPLILGSGEHNFSNPIEDRTFPRKGDVLTMLDSALVSSGIASSWLKTVLQEDDEFQWQKVTGRRPIITHSEALSLEHPLDSKLIQASGRIVSLIRSPLEMEHLHNFVEKSIDAGIGKLTLRVSLNPELQPVIQRELDICLRRSGGTKTGFITRASEEDHLLLCIDE